MPLSDEGRPDFKTSLRNLTGKYHTLIAGLLFIIGIAVRIFSTNQTGALWSIVGEMGTFLAAVIAIPFIYEKFIKTEERKLFLSDLDELLESKLTRKDSALVRVYEEGRLPVPNKVAFLKTHNKKLLKLQLPHVVSPIILRQGLIMNFVSL